MFIYFGDLYWLQSTPITIAPIGGVWNGAGVEQKMIGRNGAIKGRRADDALLNRNKTIRLVCFVDAYLSIKCDQIESTQV